MKDLVQSIAGEKIFKILLDGLDKVKYVYVYIYICSDRILTFGI